MSPVLTADFHLLCLRSLPEEMYQHVFWLAIKRILKRNETQGNITFNDSILNY